MKKIGRILFCFLPFLLAYAIQFLASIPITGIVFLDAVVKAPQNSSFWDMYMGFAEDLMNQGFTSVVSLFYSVSVVIVFGFWYQKKFHALDVGSIPSHFNPMILLGLLLLVPGLQYVTNYVVSFTSAIHPQWLERYERLMETAGLTDASLLLVIYAVIIGPICEELIYRGITLAYAEKEMPFFLANFLQAFLFGVYHLNVIQGVYAFFIGLFFGLIYHRTKSIFPTILLHICFNCWGIFADEHFMYKADTPFFFVFWLVLGIVLTVLGLLSVRKGADMLNQKAKAKVFTNSSDI